MRPNPDTKRKSLRQFLVALMVVLVGVSAGTWLTLKKDRPGRSQRPVSIGVEGKTNSGVSPSEPTSR